MLLGLLSPAPVSVITCPNVLALNKIVSLPVKYLQLPKTEVNNKLGKHSDGHLSKCSFQNPADFPQPGKVFLPDRLAEFRAEREHVSPAHAGLLAAVTIRAEAEMAEVSTRRRALSVCSAGCWLTASSAGILFACLSSMVAPVG